MTIDPWKIITHLQSPKLLGKRSGYLLEPFGNRIRPGQGHGVTFTVDSSGNDLLRGIWHERCPLVLESSQVEEWLSPKTPPESALKMFRLLPASEMSLEEITPKRTGDVQQSLF